MKAFLISIFLSIHTITFSQSISDEYKYIHNRQMTGLALIGIGLTSTAFASYTLFSAEDIRFPILFASFGGIVSLAGCIIITEPRQLYKISSYQIKANGVLVRF